MKILHISGSPKRERSDTLRLARAFLDGICAEQPSEVETVFAIDKDIKYCTGCLSCMRNGGKCVIDDDMREILSKILESELVVFSFPLYCFGMPAPLKALIDRTVPFSSIEMERREDGGYRHVAQVDHSRLRFVMISGCGFPSGENNFEPAVAQFRRMFGADATIITVTESPMLNIPEAQIVAEPLLEAVERAGREYALSGRISSETAAAVAKPMIPPEQYAGMVNGTR